MNTATHPGTLLACRSTSHTYSGQDGRRTLSRRIASFSRAPGRPPPPLIELKAHGMTICDRWTWRPAGGLDGAPAAGCDHAVRKTAMTDTPAPRRASRRKASRRSAFPRVASHEEDSLECAIVAARRRNPRPGGNGVSIGTCRDRARGFEIARRVVPCPVRNSPPTREYSGQRSASTARVSRICRSAKMASVLAIVSAGACPRRAAA